MSYPARAEGWVNMVKWHQVFLLKTNNFLTDLFDPSIGILTGSTIPGHSGPWSNGTSCSPKFQKQTTLTDEVFWGGVVTSLLDVQSVYYNARKNSRQKLRIKMKRTEINREKALRIGGKYDRMRWKKNKSREGEEWGSNKRTIKKQKERKISRKKKKKMSCITKK